MANPVRAVSVVSTGSVEIRPEHVETAGSPLFWWLLTSRRWTARKPINVYVVEHERGLLLFDTGQDRASVTDPGYFPDGIVGWFYRRLARFHIQGDETLTASLRRIGYDIGDVRTVVLSHLHQDHIGGLRELTGAEILVSAKEWRLLQGHGAALRGLMRNHIDLPGLRWRRIDFESGGGERVGDLGPSIDLFGDGSALLLPTPGHTPGSVSLLVSGEGRPPLLLVGDVTYDVELLRQGRVPGVGSVRRLRSTTRSINALSATHPDLVVLAAHDPGAADRLRAASEQPGAGTEASR